MLYVIIGDDARMHARLYGVVFGGKTERVEADREQDVIALHAAFAGDDIEPGVGLDVADVQSRSARIRELDKRVKFRFARIVARAICFFIEPTLLPLAFDRFEIVFHTVYISFRM